MKKIYASAVFVTCILTSIGTHATTITVAPAVINESVTAVNGGYNYTFSLTNNSSQILTDLYVPYFADANISGLTSPFANIQQNQVFSNPNITQVIHIFNPFTGGLQPGQTTQSITYFSPYAGIKAPFDVKFADGSSYMGDPLIPASPLALAALQSGPETPPVTPPGQGGGSGNVPEPASLALLGVGAVAFLARRRKAKN